MRRIDTATAPASAAPRMCPARRSSSASAAAAMKQLSVYTPLRKNPTGARATAHTAKRAVSLSRSRRTSSWIHTRAAASATALTTSPATTRSRVTSATARTSSGYPGMNASR